MQRCSAFVGFDRGCKPGISYLDAGWHRLQCGRLVNVTVDMARGWGDPRISEVFVGCLIFLHVPCWGDLKVMTLTSRPYCTCVERARELTNKNQQIKSHSDMSPA